MTRRLGLVLAVPIALAVAPALVVSGAGAAPASSATVSPLCTRLRTLDVRLFRQLYFPHATSDGPRLNLCTRVQSQRARCGAITELDRTKPDQLTFEIGCQGPALRAHASAGVTQFALLLNRTFTGLGPLTIGAGGPPASFYCGVRKYTGRSTLLCIHGFIPYGKRAVGVDQVSPAMSCSVRGLAALRTATGAWDIYTVSRAPRVTNGTACPTPHY
jgi:hypothetical protein